jgi:hypothetical protein
MSILGAGTHQMTFLGSDPLQMMVNAMELKEKSSLKWVPIVNLLQTE